MSGEVDPLLAGLSSDYWDDDARRDQLNLPPQNNKKKRRISDEDDEDRQRPSEGILGFKAASARSRAVEESIGGAKSREEREYCFNVNEGGFTEQMQEDFYMNLHDGKSVGRRGLGLDADEMHRRLLQLKRPQERERRRQHDDRDHRGRDRRRSRSRSRSRSLSPSPGHLRRRDDMPVRAHRRRDDDERDEDGRWHQDGEAGGVQRPATTSDPRALSLKEKIAQKMKAMAEKKQSGGGRSAAGTSRNPLRNEDSRLLDIKEAITRESRQFGGGKVKHPQHLLKAEQDDRQAMARMIESDDADGFGSFLEQRRIEMRGSGRAGAGDAERQQGSAAREERDHLDAIFGASAAPVDGDVRDGGGERGGGAPSAAPGGGGGGGGDTSLLGAAALPGRRNAWRRR
ncbi:unnamed protein product [Vitrella brassicaformis CCMP3155]|uniref:Uncharacterized protein n=1 Tax=Vitrella brassicaformis (strain CCMP3155) TaxID=1169540 RepID=A0A0G4EL83_VITBC|nr:unnamed protein product [Vitrella brassicaformis CCMP3155]|eukprot:CEL97759.1 unnamed protein product [Vitrella brassicaformis CCMP3155]